MSELSADELRLLSRYASGAAVLMANGDMVNKLIKLGYLNQKLGGAGISEKGLKLVMSGGFR